MESAIGVRKTYAANAGLEILDVLWHGTYLGHGMSVKQILEELRRRHPDDPKAVPSEKTIRNQLTTLRASKPLGRTVERLSRADLKSIDCVDPQPGWYLDAFFSVPQMRLLADSLTLARINPDSQRELISKIQDLAGAAGDGISHLTHVASYGHLNHEFLMTIDDLNHAIDQGCAISFTYCDYDPEGHLRPRLDRETGMAREYVVDPYQMVYKNGRYYLIGHLHGEPVDSSRDDGCSPAMRIFVVDRITGLDLKNGTLPIEAPAPAGFDAVAFMRHRPYPVASDVTHVRMAVIGGRMLDNVFEWFDEPAVRATGTTSKDGKPIYAVDVDAPELAVFWWALQYSWNEQLAILEPQSLRERLFEAGRQLVTAYRPQ